ncbi:F-box-like domain-containing protein [Parachlamydia sp. AcF125]|uniref:F-box protein n=1 Tax=Parachlamydia sp. AcF125 TaxID=2795736 RepID=UPI001BC93AA9|nr:F-box-like domain-containing protein [Parachlamydia sp. AcF125]MBS4168401.1 hypothetical protein [Parachlamydia sp. AcF125]
MTVSINRDFLSLPCELQLQILQELNPKDLLIAGLVCKNLKNLTDHSSVWKHHFLRSWKKISCSENIKFGKNWKQIVKKRHETTKKVRANKGEKIKDAFKHTTYKLPEFVTPETCDLTVENKFVFIKINQGSSQLYRLEKDSCQLVFNNCKDENSLLIHCYDEHIMQLTPQGHLYRWNMAEERPLRPIACLKNFEEAYFDQNFLLLVWPHRKQFVIVNAENGTIFCESISFPSAIQSLIYRNHQALIQCMDGSFYFFNSHAEDSSQKASFTMLEGGIPFPLSKHLVRFDKKRVIVLGEDGLLRSCKVWDADTGKTVFAGELKPIYLDKMRGMQRKIITALEYNGEQFAVGFNSGDIILYNPDNGASIVEAICFFSAIRQIYLEKERFVGIPEIFGRLIFRNTSEAYKTHGCVYPNRPEGFPDYNFNLAGTFYNERKFAVCSRDGWLDIWDFAKKTSPKIII